ncbi:IS30 family transposase [Clostridium tarantellae]|uniref:IS30 family transposase n=1 Tax=Clostridium tarantellae TaxID=39493 RepID=A0A6I1MRZ0_9CLOT|nr:IS30 family transposase [Clostridium tarantellae]MPQ45228.1 IS30 family transposase [Clostridium tarantellae]
MDYQNHNTESRKNKHLNMKERIIVEMRLKDGFSAYKIAKELGRSINTVLNEIRGGTTKQINQGKKFKVYFADTGEAVYKKNRLKSSRKYKLLECSNFIEYVVDKVKNYHWSLDACVGEALYSSRFSPYQMISTKTLYNYVDIGLLPIKNIDLPAKLHRNIKSTRVRNNRKKLGTSISDRPDSIESREEFGHWEIDCVLGEKSNKDNVLLTLVERKTRYAIISEMSSHSAISVTNALKKIKELFGSKFSEVFKSITADNSSEFADLSTLEKETETKTKVYFTHPYSSFEKGINERHNGLIRRFIPKGKRISDYSFETITFIENWMNTLPRKLLHYKTPEELFEIHLDEIYSL